jgi:gliding motility-associated-like protein
VRSVPGLDSIQGEECICPGQPYTYTAFTPAPGSQIEWTVQDGPGTYARSGQSLNVSWTSGGPYRLEAVQRSAAGCASPPVALDVEAWDQLTITGPDTLCREEVATYQASPFPGQSYGWTVSPPSAGEVLSAPTSFQAEVLWTEAGPGTIEVAACGLAAPLTVQVDERPEPEVLHPDRLCPGETASVSTATLYHTYAWYDENGTLLSDLATPNLGPGTYRIEVENDAGCRGQASFAIGQYPPPSVRISSPDLQSVCNGTFVTLVASEAENGYTYQWFRNGNPLGPNASLFTTNQVGTYRVEITDANGCTALSNAINLQNCAPIDGDVPSPPSCPPPSAVSFSWSVNGDCNDLQFANTTANGIPGSWFWSFNDPDSGPANTSTAENPSHIFTAAGYYRVFMQGDVETPTGDTVTCATLEVISVPIAADFDFADACPDAVVPFEDASTFLPAETLTGWNWNFGDPASGANNTSTLQNPDHLFSGPGTYTVTLVVTGSGGCTARRSKTITIFDRPPADFPDPADACEGTAVAFDAALGPGVVEVEWNFGDPVSGAANTATQATTQHLYEAAGTYSVSLEAEDIRGCRNTVIKTATILPNTLSGTIAQAPPSPLCAGDSLLQQAPPGGAAWQWSDGSTTESIWIDEAGVYAVTLTDDAGCTYVPPAATVDVEPAPPVRIRAVAYDNAGRLTGFTYDSLAICAGQEIRLEAEGPGGSTYFWSDSQTTKTIAFTAAEGNLLPPGTYTFSVSATAQASGCMAVDSFRLIVHPGPGAPQIQASAPEPRCPGTDYTFSLSNPEAGLDYRWNNGQTGPSMTTDRSGQYFVSATNAFGCTAESAPLAIATSPDIRAIPAGCLSRCGPDSLCVPEVPGVERYRWLQDGLPTGTESEEVPELIAFESGTYTLEMTDTLGCVFRSDPLTLELYPGYGRIQGGVYVDVNNNGILDKADTLHSGPSILLQQGVSAPDAAISQDTGYVFIDAVAGLYQLQLDTASLPPWLHPYYTQVDSNLLFCGDTLVVDWLLRFECPDLQTTDSLFLCQGQSISYQGISIASDTSFIWTTITSYGCDSSVQVVARSIPPVQSQLQLEACSGSSVSYEGENLLPGETRTFTLPAANGCDSVVQVEVLELFPSDSSLTLWACSGETVNYAGAILSAGQQQTFTFTGANGCDSLVEVSVSELAVSSSELELRTCPGEPVEYQGEALQAGEQRTFVLTSSLGCDSLVQVEVTAFSELLLTAEATESCADRATGAIRAQADSGAPGPFNFQLDEGSPQASSVFEELPPGAYLLAVEDGNGCRSETEVLVPARPPLEVFAPDYAFPCDAGQLMLRPQVRSGEGPDLQFQWMDGLRLPERMVYAPGTFSLTVSNACESQQLDIPVPLDYGTYEYGIYVPNAFSPNGDGRNDLFQAFTGPEVVVQEFELLVFDRWGNLLIRIRDPQDGWDGTHQGRPMNSAVFVWWLRARIIACGQDVAVRKEGDVLLVR